MFIMSTESRILDFINGSITKLQDRLTAVAVQE